jgi:hypothetical protein
VRETALNETHRPFERDGLWGKDEVHVVGHDDEGVQFEMALATIVLKGFEEEFSVRRELE